MSGKVASSVYHNEDTRGSGRGNDFWVHVATDDNFPRSRCESHDFHVATYGIFPRSRCEPCDVHTVTNGIFPQSKNKKSRDVHTETDGIIPRSRCESRDTRQDITDPQLHKS